MVHSATVKVPRLTAETTVRDISWIRTVTMGTAISDQTMKKGFPTLDFGERSP